MSLLPPDPLLPPSINGWRTDIQGAVEDCRAASERWFPASRRVDHHLIALVGELGEFANIFKKADRGDFRLDDPEVAEELGKELADVLIYVLNLAEVLNLDLAQAYVDKQMFNEERFGHE